MLIVKSLQSHISGFKGIHVRNASRKLPCQIWKNTSFSAFASTEISQNCQVSSEEICGAAPGNQGHIVTLTRLVLSLESVNFDAKKHKYDLRSNIRPGFKPRYFDVSTRECITPFWTPGPNLLQYKEGPYVDVLDEEDSNCRHRNSRTDEAHVHVWGMTKSQPGGYTTIRQNENCPQANDIQRT